MPYPQSLNTYRPEKFIPTRAFCISDVTPEEYTGAPGNVEGTDEYVRERPFDPSLVGIH